MYNKLFAKIVTSSIWLEPDGTRLVWLMFIALMNEDGFVQFASVANVAHQARITLEAAEEAIRILEAPDPNSADTDHDGRRIEKVPGGWMILNAEKYRDLVTREMVKAQTRERVARHRAKTKDVTLCNGDVTQRNGTVTQSDTDTDTKKEPPNPLKGESDAFDLFWKEYPNKQAKIAARKAWLKVNAIEHPDIMNGLEAWKRSPSWLKDDGQFIPHPATFLNQRRWEDPPRSAKIVAKSKSHYLPPPNSELTEEELAANREKVRALTEQLKKQLTPTST